MKNKVNMMLVISVVTAIFSYTQNSSAREFVDHSGGMKSSTQSEEPQKKKDCDKAAVEKDPLNYANSLDQSFPRL